MDLLKKKLSLIQFATILISTCPYPKSEMEDATGYCQAPKPRIKL